MVVSLFAHPMVPEAPLLLCCHRHGIEGRSGSEDILPVIVDFILSFQPKLVPHHGVCRLEGMLETRSLAL